MSEIKSEAAVLDVRGLACPEPVFRARTALLKGRGAGLDAHTDSAATRDNLVRLAGRERRAVEVLDRPDGTWIVRFAPVRPE